jgi:hypothetical protein
VSYRKNRSSILSIFLLGLLDKLVYVLFFFEGEKSWDSSCKDANQPSF